jgi:SH3 domain protein
LSLTRRISGISLQIHRMNRLLLLWLAVFAAAIPSARAAETAFVIDKLLVGVHQEENLSSAIVKVLPTGTKLEVLSRKGEIAKIKDPSGVTGWVDAAYLMKDAPAADLVKQLKLDKQALADRVKALEAGGPSGPPGKVDSLTNENTELKSQLSAQKLKNSELETSLAELRKNKPAPAGGTVAAELQAANLKLKNELERAQEANEALQREAPTGAISSPRLALDHTSSVALLGVGALLLGSFGGGIYLMDYLNRRRHGGYRV